MGQIQVNVEGKKQNNGWCYKPVSWAAPRVSFWACKCADNCIGANVSSECTEESKQ